MKKINFIFVAITAISLFLSCMESPEISQPTEEPNENIVSGNFTYLALGDSYTIGEAVAAEGRFPAQLTDSLKKKGFNITGYDIVARTGWTVQEMLAGVEARTDLKKTYSMVSLLIGVNDQYRGYDPELYKVNFPKALDKALSFVENDPKRVVVVSIPDYAYTPFGDGRETISQGIDLYNSINREITLSRGISYIEITDISRKGLDEKDLVARDNLHPSAKQYSLWTLRILNGFPLIQN